MIDALANLDAVCSATASRTEGGWRALDLPVLAPGEERVTRLEVRVSPRG